VTDEEIVLPEIGTAVMMRYETLFLVSQRLGAKKVRAYEGYLQFPGGHVNKGERLEEAALREFHEETGILWTANVNPPVHVDDSHLVSENWMTIYYLIDAPDSLEIPSNPEPLKHLPWVWMEERDIRTYGKVMPGIVDALDLLHACKGEKRGT
jgi:8-oxo-dGTP diphosphatase